MAVFKTKSSRQKCDMPPPMGYEDTTSSRKLKLGVSLWFNDINDIKTPFVSTFERIAANSGQYSTKFAGKKPTWFSSVPYHNFLNSILMIFHQFNDFPA